MPGLHVSRRRFIKAGAAAVALASAPRAWSRTRRSEKLRIAVVGTQNQAAWNLSQIQGEQIVGICDVDLGFLEQAGATYPGAKRYRDFRGMLSGSLEYDAVLVAAPDHIHAPAAALALRRGKHVYCEKPLAHTVEEARVLATLAKEKGLATQMGTQIHAGANYRRVVELVRSGIIGNILEVHVWCGKSWSGGTYGESKPPPANLDWDLWLGPAAKHDYCDGIHPAQWRRFWEYGTGTLGDMACHHMDLAHWALELGHPLSVHAQGPPVDAVGTPAWLIVRYEHPAKGQRAPVTVTWYDGEKRPEVLATLKNADGTPLSWGDGNLFVGESGMIIADYGSHRLLRNGIAVEFTPPAPSIPDSAGHHAEWIAACKTGSPTTCHFGYSGMLSEAVLLGNVSYRVGKKLEWDPVALRASNAPEADTLIKHHYREGWML
ncbi:MAG: Gfo/Idh/MocA family protein [Phycisphaerales bacterium]